MPAIKIRIGAAADRSTEVVFSTLEKRAQRAGDVIQRNLAGSGRGGPYRTAARAANDAYDAQTRAAQRSAQQQTRAIQAASRQQVQAFRQAARAAEREHAAAVRNMERGYRQLANVAGREMVRARRAQERAGVDFARRTSHRASRFLTPNAPLASWSRRAAGDIIRGAGVDWSLSAGMQRNLELQQNAVNLSNAAYIKGPGIAGTRQDPNALIGEVRSAADYAGMPAEQAMAGMQGFVRVTGDLATARALLKDMARLSKATGADMGEMVAAAGQVSQSFGDAATSEEDAKKRASQVVDVMRVIAGQGKLGTLEIGDLATQMSRLSSSAAQFAGDRSKNIATMGALAQFAKEGGATSAAEQTRSASAFVQTLKTPARRSAFRKMGVAVEAGAGKLRDPQAVILDALKAAGTDTEKWNAMFKNIPGERGLTMLRQRYLEAGGGARGEAAVRSKFREFGAGAAIGADEEKASFDAAMRTSASKAQQFNNALDRIAEDVAGEVLPALEKLGPTALDLARTIGNVTTWMVENPKKTIALAISTAIGRAGLESVFRSGIERVILGPGGAVPGNGRAAAVGNVASQFGAALAITAAAVTITALGMVAIDKVGDAGVEKQRRDVATDLQIANLKEHVRTGNLTPDTVKEYEALASSLRSRIREAGESGFTNWYTAPYGVARGAAQMLTGERSWKAVSGAAADAKDVGRMQEQLAELSRIMGGVKDGTLKVQVVNTEDLKQATVNPYTREGAPTGFRFDQNPM